MLLSKFYYAFCLSLNFAAKMELSSLLYCEQKKKIKLVCHTAEIKYARCLLIGQFIAWNRSKSVHIEITYYASLQTVNHSRHFLFECECYRNAALNKAITSYIVILCVLHGPWHCLICTYTTSLKIHGSFSMKCTQFCYTNREKITTANALITQNSILQLVFVVAAVCYLCLLANYRHIDL